MFFFSKSSVCACVFAMLKNEARRGESNRFVDVFGFLVSSNAKKTRLKLKTNYAYDGLLTLRRKKERILDTGRCQRRGQKTINVKLFPFLGGKKTSRLFR